MALSPPGDSDIFVCPALTADTTEALKVGALTFIDAKGTATAADPCDYFVFDMTNSLGGDVKVEAYSDSLSYQGIVVPSESKCTTSSMTANVHGQLPSTFTYENGGFVFHPGKWETITLFKEYGHWGGNGSCFFPAFQQVVNLSGGSGVHLDSPYVLSLIHI